MSGKQEFINFVESMLEKNEMPENAMKYYNSLKNVPEKEKPMFTDNGKEILLFLREHQDNYPSKSIAEELGKNSRSVSGAMRKLVSDGFVEKVGVDPITYHITDKGMEVDF